MRCESLLLHHSPPPLFEKNNKYRILNPIKYIEVSKNIFKLTEDLFWYDGKEVIKIPVGFMWNGASIPKMFQWFFKVDQGLAASCIHDWLYRYHFAMVYDYDKKDYVLRKCIKWYADCQWYSCLRNCYGEPFYRDFILTASVVLFGWYAWLSKGCKFNCKWCNYHSDKKLKCCLSNTLETLDDIDEEHVLTHIEPFKQVQTNKD